MENTLFRSFHTNHIIMCIYPLTQHIKSERTRPWCCHPKSPGMEKQKLLILTEINAFHDTNDWTIWLSASSVQRCLQWTLYVLGRYHWLIVCWFICNVNYMKMIALSVMDRNLLTGSPFPAKEQSLSTEMIFLLAIYSLNWPHPKAFGNYTKKVSKTNWKKKKVFQGLVGLFVVVDFMFWLGIIKIPIINSQQKAKK